MKINKISNTVGQGVFSRYKKNLENEGYNVITLYLNFLENLDFMDLPLPTGISIETGIKKIVEFHHNKGEKVAIYLADYENNKERIPLIKNIEDLENLFKLKDNDVLVYRTVDGIHI